MSTLKIQKMLLRSIVEPIVCRRQGISVDFEKKSLEFRVPEDCATVSPGNQISKRIHPITNQESFRVDV